MKYPKHILTRAGTRTRKICEERRKRRMSDLTEMSEWRNE